MNTKARTLLLGALIGAATGMAAAAILNRRVVNEGETTAITTGDGIKLGVMVFGLLRAIASLGEEEQGKKKKKK
jgi:hypothetical protein